MIDVPPMSTPTGASAANSIKPLASAAKPSSFSEHNMPKDSTPRSLAFLIVKEPSGIVAPILAKGNFPPATTLGAPQTT